MSTNEVVREAQTTDNYNPLAKQKAAAKLSRIPVKVEQAPLLKKPEWNEGYGYRSGLHGPFDSEEAAIEALMEKSYDWSSPRDFIIVPVIRVEGNS